MSITDSRFDSIDQFLGAKDKEIVALTERVDQLEKLDQSTQIMLKELSELVDILIKSDRSGGRLI